MTDLELGVIVIGVIVGLGWLVDQKCQRDLDENFRELERALLERRMTVGDLLPTESVKPR